jgi:hypothetical protein
MCATLLTKNAMFNVVQNRQLKHTQNDKYSDSFQKYQGTSTGMPIANKANRGTYNLKSEEKSFLHKILSIIEFNLPFLPHYNRISFKVAHINYLTFGHHFWVRCQHQPPNVSEEKTSLSIMWISFGFRIFVMNSVIVSPCVSISLQKKNVLDLSKQLSVYDTVWRDGLMLEFMRNISCKKISNLLNNTKTAFFKCFSEIKAANGVD